MYVNIMPKGETEGLLAFVVPSAQAHGLKWSAPRCRTPGSTKDSGACQRHFWWLKMVEDCQALVKGCQHCQVYEGAVVKALLCPIKAFVPLELVTWTSLA